MTSARKLRRTRERRQTTRVLSDSRKLLGYAAESLGFTDRDILAANVGTGEFSDILMARGLELLELLAGDMHEHGLATRAELEARNGRGFLERVAAMGTPARVFVDRIRYTRAKICGFARGQYHEGIHGEWACFERSGRSGRSERRSTLRRPSLTGYVRERESSSATGVRSKLFLSGADGAFASATSRTVIRTSRSNATTERSSARRTRATERIHPGISPG